MDELVAAVEHRVGAAPLPGVGAQHAAQLTHGGGRPQVVPDDVADGDPDRAVGQRQHVVPVAADLGAVDADEVARRQLQPVDLGEGGQQAVLQRDHRGVLALVEPGVVDGQARPAREVGGEVHVARGVAAAVGQLGAERERAEHLTAGPQRHDDRRARAEPLVRGGGRGVVGERVAPVSGSSASSGGSPPANTSAVAPVPSTR